MSDFVTKLISVMTILGQIFILISLIVLFFDKENKRSFKNFFFKNGLLFAWIMSILMTLGSLYYSDIKGFEPCFLCWYQRIFMFPQVFLMGIMYLRKEFRNVHYPLAIALFGILISIYHNYLDLGGSSLIACDTGVSCTVRYVYEFGYITIPMMSFTGFALIILFLYFQKMHNFKEVTF